jgi:hypothetical protein
LNCQLKERIKRRFPTYRFAFAFSFIDAQRFV